MTEEIFDNLKKRYNTVRIALAAKWLSNEMENKETEESYDIPLLTIFYKELDNGSVKHPLIQVRMRSNGQDSEFVMVFQNNGAFKKTEDADEDLRFIAENIEGYTEKFLDKFDDITLEWEWID